MKKEITFVISRVISAEQGSAPPMENFRVFQTKKAEGSCEGSNTFTSVTWEYIKPQRPSKCKLLNLEEAELSRISGPIRNTESESWTLQY